MKEKTKKVIVLLSGGLDSSCLAYYAAKNSSSSINRKVYTLTIDYGQRHKKEILSAESISKKIGAVQHKIIKFDLTKWGGSSLTDSKINVPLSRNLNLHIKQNQKAKSIPNTYVPARNTIFLSFALSYAEAVGAGEIYIGVNSVDYSGYVDCRPEFIKKYQELIRLATNRGVNGDLIKIKTPLINLSKAGIVKFGEKLGVDWMSTWSCYLGEKLACGLCDSCKLRLKGFKEAGFKDPLSYRNYPGFYQSWLREWLYY